MNALPETHKGLLHHNLLVRLQGQDQVRIKEPTKKEQIPEALSPVCHVTIQPGTYGKTPDGVPHNNHSPLALLPLTSLLLLVPRSVRGSPGDENRPWRNAGIRNDIR